MIDALKQLRNPNQNSEEWIKYLYFTKEKNYNFEHLAKVKSLSNKLVYNYAVRNLEILNNIVQNKKISKDVIHLVEETIKWSEIAKVGTRTDRKRWTSKKFDLNVHNIGSSQIYVDENKQYNEIVRVLIKTHGLIGQYLRGEIKLNKNEELYELIANNLIDKNTLTEVLSTLNQCVVGAVSLDLYNKLEKDIENAIEQIVNNKFPKSIDIVTRMNKLNSHMAEEDNKQLKTLLENPKIKTQLEKVFNSLELWYFEAALNDFSLLEQVKILLLAADYVNDETHHLTFANIMKTIYMDYKEKKVVNIYKKRIIESYIASLEIESIIENNIKPNPHISFNIVKKNNTLLFNFKFSAQALKLIEFCQVAYTSNVLYQKSVFLLYDLFGFRRDDYDRFYNEIDYLNTMNASLQHKAVILDYMVGKNILDVGPGGGALMDVILERDSSLNVFGIDIAANVIDALNKKKIEEKRKWTVVKGDALNIDKFFTKGAIDTIIYSSIIHELFSYIKYNGRKFNHDTVIQTLKSAYSILPSGGRIIIRDGIMTEPTNQYRIIEFRNPTDMNILNRYCQDFKGRTITYEKITDNKVKMLVNDAMEFLYTYTWGEESYPLEINEQFGYLTPSLYKQLINDNLENCNIVMCHAFLQDGYEQNLLNKITIYNEEEQVIKLPNSTCIIVIEKR